MGFKIVIPARHASSRLPGKPLLDIAGKPMVVRVLDRALAAGADEVWVATDHKGIATVVERAGGQVVLTAAEHPSGTDRLAEVATRLGWSDDTVVVNVQGDEPLMDPALVNAVAQLLVQDERASMSTAAHHIDSVDDFNNPNVVKVVLDAAGAACYFSRAPIPWWRDGSVPGRAELPTPRPLRHIGIYGYRVGFLRQFPKLPQAPLETTEALEQLRVLWHGYRIAVHISADAPGPGVDTPQDLERVRRHFNH